MNGDKVRLMKEVVMACLIILSQHLFGETEENHNKSHWVLEFIANIHINILIITHSVLQILLKKLKQAKPSARIALTTMSR